MNLAQIGKQLKAKRRVLKLSQFDVAEQIGVTQAFIARIENGVVADVSYNKIECLKQVLDGKLRPISSQRKERHSAIIAALTCEGFRLRDIADELDIHDSTVGSVVAGKGRSRRVEERIFQITGLRPYYSNMGQKHG